MNENNAKYDCTLHRHVFLLSLQLHTKSSYSRLLKLENRKKANCDSDRENHPIRNELKSRRKTKRSQLSDSEYKQNMPNDLFH